MKFKTFSTKKVILYITGLIILSQGIVFIIQANLGSAPWDLLSVGEAESGLFSIGQWQILNNLAMIILTKLLFKGKWNFICLIPGIIQGVCIDWLQKLPIIPMDPYPKLLLGCIVSGIGLAIYISQGYTANAIDNFTYQLHDKKKLSKGIAKLICDMIPIVLCLLLSIAIKLPTILVYVLVPVFMEVTLKVMNFLGRKSNSNMKDFVQG